MLVVGSSIYAGARSAPTNQRSVLGHSVFVSSDGTILAACRLGSDREGLACRASRGGSPNRDTHVAWGSLDGRTWTLPVETGLPRQHCSRGVVGGDRRLAIHTRRREPPGVRAVVSEDLGRSWAPATEIEVYGSRLAATPATAELAPKRSTGTWAVQFGDPRGAVLSSWDVLVVCCGGEVATRPTHWARLEVA